MNIKNYSIAIGKYNANKDKYYGLKYNLEKNIEILLKITYYDNCKKKIEDLKEYICDITNYKFCPCLLKICNKRVSEFNYFLDLDFINKDDSTLLSEINLKDSFYVFVIDNKCNCSFDYKKRYKCTKLELIKQIFENEKKIELFKDQSLDLKEKDQKINKIEKKLKLLEKEKENYYEYKKKWESKEEEIKDLEKKIKENEDTINNLIDENDKKEKVKIDLENQLINSKSTIDDLNNQINTITDQFNQKNEVILKMEKENKSYNYYLNSLKEELKKKNIELEKLEKIKIDNIENIKQLNEKVNNLNSIAQNQKKEIQKLNKKENDDKVKVNNLEGELKEKKEKIEEIEKEKDDYKKNLENISSEKKELEKNYQLKEENERNLKEKIEELENNNIKEKDELNKKIKNLDNEKSLLTVAINKDIGTLKQFHDLGLLKDININDNSIRIDPNTKQVIQNKNAQFFDEEIELKNFYDVIINIKSVKDISKGWEIKMTEKGKKNFNKYRNTELLTIGVIGNSNKGKSFILSKISNINFPSGTSIKTEGLSIKYPELEQFRNRKIVLLDSAGLETPVLNEEIKNEDEEDSDNEEKKSSNHISKIKIIKKKKIMN